MPHDEKECLACRNKRRYFDFIQKLKNQGAQIVQAGIGLNVWNSETEKFELECFHQESYDVMTKRVSGITHPTFYN